MASSTSSTALVLGGGGARTAYQAGVLAYLRHAFPRVDISIITGMGAGAMNASILAGQAGSWSEGARDLVAFWDDLQPERAFHARSLWDLVTQLVRHQPSAQQSLLDPAPLRTQLADVLATDDAGVLSGVQHNVNDGWLEALVVATTHYGSLETVTWSQGAPMTPSEAGRSVRPATLTLDHVMAAVSLALLFPAVSIHGEWHGAGVGLRRPAAPARTLGADRILALSTRSRHSSSHASADEVYPSPLQVASILSNTLLLDSIGSEARSDDAGENERAASPGSRETGEDVLLIEPSVDLTDVAERLDVEVDTALGTVLQYLHGEGTRLPDLLSMLLFEPEYLRRLLLVGYADARGRRDQLEHFFEG